jgi:hypothetical protein
VSIRSIFWRSPKKITFLNIRLNLLLLSRRPRLIAVRGTNYPETIFILIQGLLSGAVGYALTTGRMTVIGRTLLPVLRLNVLTAKMGMSWMRGIPRSTWGLNHAGNAMLNLLCADTMRKDLRFLSVLRAILILSMGGWDRPVRGSVESVIVSEVRGFERLGWSMASSTVCMVIP